MSVYLISLFNQNNLLLEFIINKKKKKINKNIYTVYGVGKGYVLLWRRLTQTTRWTCPQFSGTCCWRATSFHPPSPGLHVQWTGSGDDDHPVVRVRNLLKQNNNNTNTIIFHSETSNSKHQFRCDELCS